MCLFLGVQGNGSFTGANGSWPSRPHGLGPKSATSTPWWDVAPQGTPAELWKSFVEPQPALCSGGLRDGDGLLQILLGTGKIWD